MRRAAALLVLAASAVACSAAPPLIATGIVIAVDGPNVAEVDRFTLRTNHGDVIVVEVETVALDGGGKPAPHLREHLTSGAPITVEYRVSGGRNVALRYYDAP